MTPQFRVRVIIIASTTARMHLALGALSLFRFPHRGLALAGGTIMSVRLRRLHEVGRRFGAYRRYEDPTGPDVTSGSLRLDHTTTDEMQEMVHRAAASDTFQDGLPISVTLD